MADYRKLAASKILTDPKYAAEFADFRAFIRAQQAEQQQTRLRAFSGGSR